MKTKRKKQHEFTYDTCLLIQWSDGVGERNKKGDPICPRCGSRAELVIGIMGEVCWAHVPRKKRRPDD